MKTIIKAKETMTSRERVLKTFHFEKTDRVPIDYKTNPTIHTKVSRELGIEPGHDEPFLQALGVDSRMIGLDYTGKLVYKEIPGLHVDPVYGFYSRWVKNQYGGYYDFCNYPLENVDDDVIAGFSFPSPDDFDYDTAIASFSRYKDLALCCGNEGICDIINSMGRIMNMENILVGLITDNEAVLGLIDRKIQMELGILERILEKSKGRIDYMWMGEDLGTQHAPMISLDLYRRILRPRHQKFIDLGKAYSIPVMFHSCGYSSWVFEDLIDMGVDAVDALQPEATNMDPDYLMEHFGGRLSFHGCISTAGPLAYGTAEETAAYSKRTLEIMMRHGGYHFSPTHQIQDNTPVDNIIAMYQAAHDFGNY